MAVGILVVVMFIGVYLMDGIFHGKGKVLTHVVERHRLVVGELSHILPHINRWTEIDDHTAIGVLVMVVIEAYRDNVERFVAKITLRLSGYTEHPLDKR